MDYFKHMNFFKGAYPPPPQWHKLRWIFSAISWPSPVSGRIRTKRGRGKKETEEEKEEEQKVKVKKKEECYGIKIVHILVVFCN